MVKICGVCRPQDAALAAHAAADFVGVILAPGRRRTQTAAAAAEIFAQAGPLRRVGVFVDQPHDDIARTAAALRLDVIQLHGREEPRSVAQLTALTGCTIWKAIPMRPDTDLAAVIDRYGQCVHGLLLDTQLGTAPGGSGIPFDWRLAAGVRDLVPAQMELIVAGGLTPQNVGAAVAALHPDVVDVASGVEDAPGRKSVAAVEAFVRNARL